MRTKLSILLLVALALAACSQPAVTAPTIAPSPLATDTPEGCPSAAADKQLLTQTAHGYCLLYPTGYDVFHPNDSETVLAVESLLNVTQARAYITAYDAGGRTAAQFADEIVASFPGFDITRAGVSIDGEQAVVLDRLPGQDINRRVIVVHNDRLYDLTFAPIGESASEAILQTEELYATIIETFRFLPEAAGPLAPPPTTVAQPATPAGPGIQAFEAQLLQALNGRDFAQIQGLMGKSFLLAGWRSEGTAYTPEAAIEQLRTNYLGANTVLSFDPNKDMAALLGGTDPLAFISPDAREPRAMFVSGWGLEGKDEAILYIAHSADGIPYWYGVLIALGGFVDEVQSFQAYEDAQAGVALSLPESWRVGDVLPGESAIFYSYPEGKYVGGESLQPGDTKCDLFIYPAGHTVAGEADSIRTDPGNQILSESEITLPSGVTAILFRYTAPLAGEVARVLATVDERVVALTCFGDLLPFNAIATSIRPIQ